MRGSLPAIATAALIAPTAATSQAVTSIGNSAAQSCFEAARDRRTADLRSCDHALKGVLSSADLVATHVNRGILQALKGNHSEALWHYDQAISLKPSEAEAYLNKGLLLLRLDGRAQEAVKFIDLALAKQTSKPALAYYARAIANEELGRTAAAYQDYQQAAALDPEWSLPVRELRRFRKKS